MEHLCHCKLPDMPTLLINQLTDVLSLFHLNVTNINGRHLDISIDANIEKAQILSFHETTVV